MDLDTGGFLGIVNHLAIAPISWFETIQAVELIRTQDGVAAIGMTTQGLIYLSATEARVLEGTEGMTFTCMPKGEVPSLRFICSDENGVQYIYDDGVLTVVPIRAGEAWQWLNEFEVLTRNALTDVTSVLNVETGELTRVTSDPYLQGQAAAITTSTGEQMITLRGDGYRDIFINTDDGWTFLQRMTSEMWAGDQQFSPEFFEWHDQVWILGYLSREDTLNWTTPTAVYIYDIEHDRYTQLTSVGEWKDPEVLVLNDGSLAWYADETSTTEQLYDTITYDQAVRLGKLTEFHQRLASAADLHFNQAAGSVIDMVASLQESPTKDLSAIGASALHSMQMLAQNQPDSFAPAPSRISSYGNEDSFVLRNDDSFVFRSRKGEKEDASDGLEAPGYADLIGQISDTRFDLRFR
jgi:hypothetical protein